MKLHLYILRRLVLMIPTLFGITLVTFLFVNLAPGGPIEQKLMQIRQGSAKGGSAAAAMRWQQGVSQETIDAIKKQYGFDKPLHVRYWIWIKNLTRLDFGNSIDFQQPVLSVIASRFPVSLQFGVTSFLLTYLVSVGLGLFMSYHAHKWVDGSLSLGLIILSAIPPFAVGILLLVVFAGGSFLDWFPLGYLNSENYDSMTLGQKIVDRVHHFVLPLIAYMLGSFTTLAFLCRGSVLNELNKDYIRTAQAIGVSRPRIHLRHAFRNALIPIVTGIGGFVAVFLGGSLLVETIFQLNGIGLLGYQALMSRDYNMIMGLTFLQSLALLVGNLIGDLAYVLVDPRIDFASS